MQSAEAERRGDHQLPAWPRALAFGGTFRFLDIGEKFLDKGGNISPGVMSDYIHPTPRGYAIWADALAPTLDEMLKK